MQDNRPQQAQSATPQPKLCFILGILQRSGTNYLYRLLEQHPDCLGPGPIWEDFFVFHSSKLKKYARSVYSPWNSDWEVEKKIGPPEVFMRFLGDAVCRFLRLQVTRDSESAVNADYAGEDDLPKVLLTKTPSVTGVENFHDIMPEVPLIIIIRDGRAVVESAVRSFDWDYEDGMRKWAAAARQIIGLKEKKLDDGQNYLIVKFEDLFLSEKRELSKMFAYLGIDEARFDYEGAKNLGVTGSSDTRKKKDAVHWQVTEKVKSFNPLGRFADWDRKRHERFNWIAGEYMSKLGYQIEPVASNKFLYVFRNKLYDLKWSVRKKIAGFTGK